MAGGVRLATGYITIEAETSKVPTQIKEALQQASDDLAKTTGVQMGKDISTGIRDGLKAGGTGGTGGSVSGGIGKQIQADITKGLDPKKTGEAIGKDVSTGIREGMRQGGEGGTGGGLGKQIQADITKGLDPKATGKQIGKDVSTGVREGMKQGGAGGGGSIGKQIQQDIVKDADGKKAGQDIGKDIGTGVKDEMDVTLKDALQPMRDWGQQVKDEVKRGDIKGAFGDVGDVVANTTRAISNLGDAVGADLSSVERLGTSLSEQLDELGGHGQNIRDTLGEVADHVNNTRTGLKQIRSGDIEGIKTIANVLGAIGQGDAANVVGQVHEHVKGFKGDYSQAKDFLETFLPEGLKEVASPFTAAVSTGWAAGNAIGDFQGDREAEWYRSRGLVPITATSPQTRALQEAAEAPITPQGRAGGLEMVYGGPEAAPYLKNFVASRPAAGAGAAEIKTPEAVVEASAASISVGSANLGGLSLPSVVAIPGAGAAASGGAGQHGGWGGGGHGAVGGTSGLQGFLGSLPTRRYDDGGPINQDQLAQLHKGEHVLDAGDVQAMGGQNAVQAYRDQLGQQPAQPGTPGSDALDAMRTAGFVPAAAGQQTIAGTSSLAGLFNLGNEAVGGLIDAAASAAQSGIAMGAAAGTFGAGGGAASAAAGLPIQIGADEAKRAVSYGFQLASIWTDAAVEQLFPFGAPRWIGYDYTKFMPNINTGTLATTTVEKAMQAAQGKQGAPNQQPGGPVAPEQMPGAAAGAGPTPKFGEHPAPVPAAAPPPGLGPAASAAGGGWGPGGSVSGLGGAVAAKGAGPAPADPIGALQQWVGGATSTSPAAPPPQQPAPSSNTTALNSLLGGMTAFDEGGWLMPGVPGINNTDSPELVLNQQQLNAATNGGGRGGNGVYINNITAVDADDVSRQIATRQRLNMMQYGARP